MPIGSITTGDASIREDLADILTNIDPSKTPLLSSMQEGDDAKGMLHEYLQQTYDSASNNANSEAFGFTVKDLTEPTRNTNNVQIFVQNVQVSRSQQNVDHAALDDAMQHQVQREMTNHAKDIELALMRGSRASADSGTSPQMEGVINSISTNSTTRDSGSTLGEDTYSDILEMIKNETDEEADRVYVNSTLKRDISAFTGNSNSRLLLDADDQRLVNSIDVYVSEFGPQEIVWHRNVENSDDSQEIVVMNSSLWALSWLERTKVERLANESAGRDRAQIVSYLTLEAQAEKGNAFVDGFSNNAV